MKNGFGSQRHVCRFSFGIFHSGGWSINDSPIQTYLTHDLTNATDSHHYAQDDTAPVKITPTNVPTQIQYLSSLRLNTD